MLTLGRLELLWRPGAWRHLDEWVFARQECPQGCIVLDLGFFCFTWKRHAHRAAYVGPCGDCGNDHGGHSLDCSWLDCVSCGHGLLAHLGGVNGPPAESCGESGCPCVVYVERTEPAG
jgi:hypothetical protein